MTKVKSKLFSLSGGKMVKREVRVFSTAKVDHSIEQSDIMNTKITTSKQFSQASIKQKLRDKSRSARARMNLLVRDYKGYNKSNSNKMSGSELTDLHNLFAEDFMSIVSQVTPAIKEGGQLNNLLGLNTISQKAGELARRLSPIYKKALIAEDAMGAVPKAMYQKLNETYGLLLNELKYQTFGIDNREPLINKVNEEFKN